MQRLFHKLATVAFLCIWARCAGQANMTAEPDCQASDQSVLLQHGSPSLTMANARTAEAELWLDDNNGSTLWTGQAEASGGFPLEGIIHRIMSARKPEKVVNSSDEKINQLRTQMKMKTNDEGDLKAFTSSLFANSLVLATFVLCFCVLAQRYPLVYSDNARTGAANPVPSGYFGWVTGSYRLHFEDMEKTAGLDAALFMEFTKLAIRLTGFIAIPFVLILCPLHLWFGGAVAYDKLSKIGMSNIPDGSPVFWVHAACVWYVVLLAQFLVFNAQEFFVKKRSIWMSRMPHPRSTTVLCEGIPQRYSTDDKLKDYFCTLFSEEQVESAYVIKYTQSLEQQVATYQRAEDNLAAAKHELETTGNRPHIRDYNVKLVDKIEYYSDMKREAGKKVTEERQRILQGEDVVYTNTGFVTFKRKRDAAVALYMKVEADDEIFAMSTPPDPSDVIYSDFMIKGSWLTLKETLGYACAVGLFFTFTPIIVLISSLINVEVMKKVGFVKNIFDANPAVETLTQGLLASIALQIMMAFIPTIFVLIFQTFFQLKAGQWVQARLQQWYFWFQIIFILFIPAVGSSLLDMIYTIIDHPMAVVFMLAYRLPTCTHFYLNYVVLQWFSHGMNLTRYMNLIKFKTFSAMFDSERAKELSEPEDQDYYGIGGRCARFSLVLSLALVYCSLCPLIAVVACATFAICRILYGYLIYYAETPKPDLGGVFWVAQLKHIQIMLVLYVLLMIGVLAERSQTMGPAVVVAPALIFLYKTFVRFHTAYDWEFLSFSELVNHEVAGDSLKLRPSTRDTYAQPELTSPKIQDSIPIARQA